MNLNTESNENDFLIRLIALTNKVNSRTAPITIGNSLTGLSTRERYDLLIDINNVLCNENIGGTS